MRFGKELGIPAFVFFAILACLIFVGKRNAGAETNGKPEVRIAYFPNVTHSPAIVGVASGLWSKELPNYTISPRVVNAGPEAMEALLAKEVDFSFVGPSPAINTYIKSNGKALKIIAGACQGGASLIRRADVKINGIRDLDGKSVAVPQIGGTQDVSCRYFLTKNGLKAKDQGGTVDVIPIKNADILALFLQKHIDAAWVPEPWAARIKKEAGAQTVVDERTLWPEGNFSTTVLVVRSEYAAAHPDVVASVLRAHEATLNWIATHQPGAKKVVNSELKRLTGKALASDVLDEAWSHVTFGDDPNASSIEAFAQAAVEAGYQKNTELSLIPLIDTQRLQEAREKRRK